MKHLEFNPDAGDTIVFLHGGNVAGWMWGEQIPAFDDHHLLVPDLPGFGTSNDEPWVSMADAADNVAGLIQTRAKGGTAHVVGLSLGAGVGLHLVSRHPRLVTSLLVSSASITPPSPATKLSGRLMLAAWNRRWFWHFLARGYGLPADSVELFVETGLGIRRETALAVFAETVRGLPPSVLQDLGRQNLGRPNVGQQNPADQNLGQQNPGAPVTVLAVAGGSDSTAISVDSLAVLARIDGVKTATAPGMHHQWNIENVDLFNATVRAWIDRSTLADGLVNTAGGAGEQTPPE
ncbi:pimeloyl-ACP methyl ester carboxylesterase [Conyzicola nivalis]|uniref:Pimeloyl-ACP methyl ester carboxylesterase n=1 Tax=Conyzicola nivalis TaxID=1477021 RepID=A0ABV2QMN0_9MICO